MPYLSESRHRSKIDRLKEQQTTTTIFNWFRKFSPKRPFIYFSRMYGATRRSYGIAKTKFSKSVRKITTVWDIFEEEDDASQPQNDSENLTPGKSEDNLHPTRDNPNHHDDQKRPNLKILGRKRRRKRKRRRRKSTSKQQQQQWQQIQILSFNVQGYDGGQRDKKDLIRSWIKRHDRTPTIILTQETWQKKR